MKRRDDLLVSVLRLVVAYWLALLSLFSVVPVHFAFFSLSIPQPFRPLLDLNFQLYLSSVFASHLVVAFFAGRFIYVGIVGVISDCIRKKVQNYAQRHPVLGPEGDARIRNFSSLAVIGAYQGIHDKVWVKHVRKLERLDFVVMHRNHVLKFLSRNSNAIMLGTSLLVFGLTYLGLIASIFFVLAATPVFLLVQAAESARLALRQKRFSQGGKKSVNWDWTGPNTLAVFAMILLLFSAAAGYLRGVKLAKSPPIYVSLGDQSVPISIVASTGSGLLVYGAESESYRFLSFGDFGKISSKKD